MTGFEGFTTAVKAAFDKPKYFIAFALACATILLIPEEWAVWLGLDGVRQESRMWIGLGLLVSSAIALVNIGDGAWPWYKARRDSKRRKKDAEREAQEKLAEEVRKLEEQRKLFESMSPDEKAILCDFMLRKTKTLYLNIQDGVVTSLLSAKVLYRGTPMGNPLEDIAFNIHSWAWDFLNEGDNLELITRGAPKSADGRVLPYRRP